jgi:DNA modification methylase
LAYVAKLVEVFHEVRRVLRKDGTLWLNLGDSYSNSSVGRRSGGTLNKWKNGGRRNPDVGEQGITRVSGMPPKNLLGIPWRVAFALQADGWILRQEIIWAKPNTMPESVMDRCTKAHEQIFLLAKSSKYYFDHDAIKEPVKSSPKGCPPKRNRRSVWTVNTKPYKGAHFATFPPALIEPCVLAGCPREGVVLDPFGGSGTTAFVANTHGRNALLIEINPAYVMLAEARLSAGAPAAPPSNGGAKP